MIMSRKSYHIMSSTDHFYYKQRRGEHVLHLGSEGGGWGEVGWGVSGIIMTEMSEALFRG